MNMDRPDYDLIVSAVNGDNDALEKILQIYESFIEEVAGGNEDIRQSIRFALIEGIRQYRLEHPEKNEAYSSQNNPEEQ